MNVNISLYISNSGHLHLLSEKNEENQRCCSMSVSETTVIGIAQALQRNDRDALIAAITILAHSTRRAELIDVYSIQALHLVANIQAWERTGSLIPETLSVDKNGQRSLVNRVRMEHLNCTKKVLQSFEIYSPGFFNDLGLDVCWPEFCAAHHGVEFYFIELPIWIQEIINEYWEAGSHQTYVIKDRVLVDTDAAMELLSGWGMVLGYASALNNCFLQGSIVVNSTVADSDIDGGCVIGASVTRSALHNTGLYTATALECEIFSSVIWSSNLKATNISNASIGFSDMESCRLAVSFILAIGKRLDMQGWSTRGLCIHDMESYSKALKQFRKTPLSRKVYDYYCKEADGLKSSAETAGQLVYGLELEVLPTDSATITYKPSYCRIKPDGSLSDGGLEIVTRPDVLELHTRNLRRMFRINSLKTDDSCGMHIHIPRDAAKSKFIKNRIYNNKERYYRIAGRQENKYCQYIKRRDRYEAVNASGDTIEFRLFSGTVSIHKIRRRLQWVKAMCEWSKKQKDEPVIIKQPEANATLAGHGATITDEAIAGLAAWNYRDISISYDPSIFTFTTN